MDAQTQTPEVSLADMSLADYRASRDAAPAVETEAPKEPAPAERENVGESAAEREGAADDSPETESEEDKSEQQPKKKGGWQRKIERQERQIEELRAQLAERSSAGTASEQQETAQPETVGQSPQFDKPKPKLEDFDSLEQFTEALTDWKLDKQTFEREAAAAQAKIQDETRQIVDKWNERKAEFLKEHADFDEAMADVEDITLPPAQQRLILESEHGPELAYTLAQDREALARFAAMHPIAAAREIGKLEAQLASSDTPVAKEPKVSNAPRPIKPVASRTAAHAGTPDIGKMSLADYRRAREAGRI
jgi:hypothetical protein